MKYFNIKAETSYERFGFNKLLIIITSHLLSEGRYTELLELYTF